MTGEAGASGRGAGEDGGSTRKSGSQSRNFGMYQLRSPSSSIQAGIGAELAERLGGGGTGHVAVDDDGGGRSRDGTLPHRRAPTKADL